jgi:predicted RNase H-like nuclease (RuvC/YqgF family)
MGTKEECRLEAEAAGLDSVIHKAETDLERLTTKKTALKKEIDSLKQIIGRLEAKGPTVVSIVEYRRLRVRVVQLYNKELASCEMAIRDQNKNLKALTRDLKSTQEALRTLQKPRLA